MAKAKEQDIEKVKGVMNKMRAKRRETRKEFIEFLNRGSVIDLAIGVAVGGAFNTIVNSLVNDIVTPIVGLVVGGVDFTNLAIRIPNFFGTNDAATISYGKFIQSVLQFLVVAYVFFRLMKILNGISRRKELELARLEKKEKEKKEQEKKDKKEKNASKTKKSTKK